MQPFKQYKVISQPYRTLACTANTSAQPVINLSAVLALTLLLVIASFSPVLYADKITLSADQIPPPSFYQQLRLNTASETGNSNKTLLEQVMPNRVFLEPLVASDEQADDLAFNYLWLQQHQEGYSRREGGSAAGKLLRMGIKSLYKNYSGNSSINTTSESDFNSSLFEVDYRLRLSGDKVKFGVEYVF